MNKKNIKTVFETLERMYPNASTELNRKTHFQLLVAVMLSAQTTDKQVNKVTKELFTIVHKPKDIVDMWIDTLMEKIKSIGLYKTKGKHIYQTSKILCETADKKWKEDYIIPQAITELTKLPGVWEKTAKVVSATLYGTSVIAVDTHVHRLANRLWLVSTKQAGQTSKLIEEAIPIEYKSIAHHTLVLFWRYHCTARNPKCETCPIQWVCKYYKQHVLKTLKT